MTNDPSDKPREFWITYDTRVDDFVSVSTQNVLVTQDMRYRVIHVIEYTAYQSAIERVKRLEEAGGRSE